MFLGDRRERCGAREYVVMVVGRAVASAGQRRTTNNNSNRVAATRRSDVCGSLVPEADAEG